MSYHNLYISAIAFTFRKYQQKPENKGFELKTPPEAEIVRIIVTQFFRVYMDV